MEIIFDNESLAVEQNNYETKIVNDYMVYDLDARPKNPTNISKFYLFANEEEIFKFKAKNKNVNFPTQFLLGSISNGFGATESREVSLKGNVYDVSVDYNSIDKSDILNIHKC